jgi:hypothetical protein
LCELGRELPGSVKDGFFLDLLSGYQLLAAFSYV